MFIVGAVGTAAELLLLEHTESFTQWLPLMGLLAATVVIIAAAVRPGRTILRLVQGVMIGIAVVGVLGVWLHYSGNVEFARETYPHLTGLPLAWESMRGATPSLAPGLLVQQALVGLLYTYRHPAWRIAGSADSG